MKNILSKSIKLVVFAVMPFCVSCNKDNNRPDSLATTNRPSGTNTRGQQGAAANRQQSADEEGLQQADTKLIDALNEMLVDSVHQIIPGLKSTNILEIIKADGLRAKIEKTFNDNDPDKVCELLLINQEKEDAAIAIFRRVLADTFLKKLKPNRDLTNDERSRLDASLSKILFKELPMLCQAFALAINEFLLKLEREAALSSFFGMNRQSGANESGQQGAAANRQQSADEEEQDYGFITKLNNKNFLDTIKTEGYKTQIEEALSNGDAGPLYAVLYRNQEEEEEAIELLKKAFVDDMLKRIELLQGYPITHEHKLLDSFLSGIQITDDPDRFFYEIQQAVVAAIKQSYRPIK